MTNRKVDYLINFKLKSSNMPSTPKVHKCKTIQEPIAISSDHYIEVFQPEYLKERQIISGRNSPIQHLSYFIENLLKLIVPCLVKYIKDD